VQSPSWLASLPSTAHRHPSRPTRHPRGPRPSPARCLLAPSMPCARTLASRLMLNALRQKNTSSHRQPLACAAGDHPLGNPMIQTTTMWNRHWRSESYLDFQHRPSVVNPCFGRLNSKGACLARHLDYGAAVIIEGVTEFLPVSSTPTWAHHLSIASHRLGSATVKCIPSSANSALISAADLFFGKRISSSWELRQDVNCGDRPFAHPARGRW